MCWLKECDRGVVEVLGQFVGQGGVLAPGANTVGLHNYFREASCSDRWPQVWTKSAMHVDLFGLARKQPDAI